MTIVQSYGALRDVVTEWSPGASYGSMRLYDRYNYSYAWLYRTQPNVRTCVDFLARNIAQLGLHVFERRGETDRLRLRDHPLAQLISKPNPWTTRYRLMEALMGDLGVYFNAYWLKVAQGNSLSLLRVPPPLVEVKGGLAPVAYSIDLGAGRQEYEPGQIVHFRGYSAESATVGLSPLETLRRVLAEEQAMGDYREGFWQNGARMYGLIERPKDAPSWSEEARERFRIEFEELYAGTRNSGRTAILEEGMTWKQAQFDAQESEYLSTRKLTREECARAYHIPLPMVGILDHATFSNIKDQHKQLYQDSMGPWLTMIEEEIALQLLPEFEMTSGVYVEFNIQEKLQGSFEEQTQSMQSAVGRPWMTANEARARLNLPSLEGDADQLVTPLNVLVGGQASPRDSAPPSDGGQAAAQDSAAHSHELGHKAAQQGRIDPTQPALRARHEAQWRQAMERTFKRQRDAIVGKVPEKAASGETKQVVSADEIWDTARWDRELRTDIYRLNTMTATAWGEYVTGELEVELDAAQMLPWLSENARIAAEEINATTKAQIAEALTQEEPRSMVQRLFEVAISSRAAQIATSRVTTASVFGAQEGARQGGVRRKTWQVNSSNPRDEHKALDGETVGIEQVFSNGMRWPGDPAGGADNNANCQCSVTFGRD